MHISVPASHRQSPPVPISLLSVPIVSQERNFLLVMILNLTVTGFVTMTGENRSALILGGEQQKLLPDFMVINHLSLSIQYLAFQRWTYLSTWLDLSYRQSKTSLRLFGPILVTEEWSIGLVLIVLCSISWTRCPDYSLDRCYNRLEAFGHMAMSWHSCYEYVDCSRSSLGWVLGLFITFTVLLLWLCWDC